MATTKLSNITSQVQETVGQNNKQETLINAYKSFYETKTGSTGKLHISECCSLYKLLKRLSICREHFYICTECEIVTSGRTADLHHGSEDCFSIKEL